MPVGGITDKKLLDTAYVEMCTLHSIMSFHPQTVSENVVELFRFKPNNVLTELCD